MKQLDNNTVIEIISYIESQINNYRHAFGDDAVLLTDEVCIGYELALNHLKDHLQSYIENQVNHIEIQ